MFKLMKWLLPTVLCILPALSAEKPIVEVTDTILVKLGTAPKSTTNSLVWISEPPSEGKDGKVRMTIEGQDGSVTKSVTIEPTLVIVGFANEDDETKTYQEVVDAKVKCGDLILCEKLTRSQRISYPSQQNVINMIGGSAVADDALPLGAVADLRQETLYIRPSDKGLLKKRGPVVGQIMVKGLFKDQEIMTPEAFLKLGATSINVHKTKYMGADTRTTDADPVIYQLILKEKISPIAGAVYLCVDHNFQEKSFRGLRTVTQQRCCLATYEQFSSSHQVWTRSPTGAETLIHTDPAVNKVLLFETTRQVRNGQNIPVEHCLAQKHQYLPSHLPHEIVNVKPTPN